MRRAICARKHRFRIHSDDVNERVYCSLFRTVVSRILYAYFETSDLVSSLVYSHARDACLPACHSPLLYVFSLFQSLSLSRARTRSTVSFLLDVCFNHLSFLLTFVKIFKIGYNFGYDYKFRFLIEIVVTHRIRSKNFANVIHVIEYVY